MPANCDRRQWLKTSAAACAATLLERHATAQQPASVASSSRPLRKAIKFSMLKEKLAIADKFKLIKDLGFEGVEIHTSNVPDRQEVLRAIEATGLPVHGVLNSSNPDIRAAIDLAKYWGATSVLVVAGKVDAKTSYDANYRQTQKLIRESAERAAQQQIRLLVENVWNGCLLSPLEMARYLDEIASPWVGSYFDVGNVVHEGYPEQWLRILGKRVGKVDIKDYSRRKQRDEGSYKGFDIPLGEGDVDWAAVRQALSEIGYSGWATAEVRGGDRTRLADIAKRMDRVLGNAER